MELAARVPAAIFALVQAKHVYKFTALDRTGKASARQPGGTRYLPCSFRILNEPMRVIPAQHESNRHVVAIVEKPGGSERRRIVHMERHQLACLIGRAKVVARL